MIQTASTTKETDAKLVSRIRGGDISAFKTVVERYRVVIVACANSRVRSLADAEDIAQEAFVKAYFHINELRDPEALLPWLRRVTERLVLAHLRKHREVSVAPEFLEMIADKHECNGFSTETVEIESILTELPKAMRDSVSLTLLSGYTCAEAASILGVKEGTVKSRLARARARLKEVFDVTEQNSRSNQAAGDFTQRTIERLRSEARRLVAEGNLEEAVRRAEDVIREQVKPLFGDPQKLGLAKTFLAAYDSTEFKPDEEAVGILGLPYKERRKKECETNAEQYGFELNDLDWELADVDVMSETLAKPVGYGRDTWGVPVSRVPLDIADSRTLCQRLAVSPLCLWEWVQKGAPILRCWPFARFDVDRVVKWLAENEISSWPAEDEHCLEWPIQIIFREVYNGNISLERAEEVMRDLGYGVWEAPMPELTGGW